MIDGVSPLSPAERMRRYRTRRRNGHTCITVELREDEIAALISCGLLEMESRRHRHRAARPSRPQFNPLDANMVTRNGHAVTRHGLPGLDRKDSPPDACGWRRGQGRQL
jgi:hypothetical protein